MPDQFHGVLPALITPFTDDGADLDAGALAAIVERLVAARRRRPRARREHRRVHDAQPRRAAAARRAHDRRRRPGACPVVAGTGALSTAETVELSVHAERAGAAAVMIVPPFYDALGWRELLAHYRAVAAAHRRSRSSTTTSPPPPA